MSIEELKKSPLVERIEKYAGGGMGNGEKNNAMFGRVEGCLPPSKFPITPPLVETWNVTDHKKPNLCTCGPKTRAEQGCNCEVYREDEFAPKESVLQEADRLVSTDRGSTYGHPLDDFSKVVGMAKALWGRGPESAEEHALYLVLLKLARLQATPGHHDSIVDAAGYLKTYAMVIEERVKRITDKG